jgi:hypothetical protein
MSPVYRAYDRALRNELSSSFGQADGSAAIDKSIIVYPPGTDIRKIALNDALCRMQNGDDAAGAIALRRELSPGPGKRTLSARIGLVDCQGYIIDSTNIAPAQLDTSQAMAPQVADFVRKVHAALRDLAGPGDRLANFAADGLPLGDSEMRGFYRVDHLDKQTYINYAWANGASADKSKIFTQTAVESIDGVDAATLASLDERSMDALLTMAGGSLKAQIVSPTTNTIQDASLVAYDRCTYLRRRFENKGNTYIDSKYERSEIL